MYTAERLQFPHVIAGDSWQGTTIDAGPQGMQYLPGERGYSRDLGKKLFLESDPKKSFYYFSNQYNYT